MKRIISKSDNKEYFLAVCNKGYIGDFLSGKLYQVRKATKEDCKDYEDYCVVNGTFFANSYNGNIQSNKLVSKKECKIALTYI